VDSEPRKWTYNQGNRQTAQDGQTVKDMAAKEIEIQPRILTGCQGYLQAAKGYGQAARKCQWTEAKKMDRIPRK
jgi:hypothetical protein